MARKPDAPHDSEPDHAALDEAAADLYALPADQFTAARNERAKSARDAGDRSLAAAIGKLVKPTADAWLANQLVRDTPDRIESLVRIGQSMREATAALDRDELRRLSGEQRDATAALVARARELAADAGQRATEQTIRALEATLHAALADPDAARELAAGRITTTLRTSGFPLGSADAVMRAEPVRSVAAPPVGYPTKTARAKSAATEKATAKAAQEAADTAGDHELAAARQAVDDARAVVTMAHTVVRDTTATVERLRIELENALAARRDADRELRAARTAVDRAEQAAQRVARRLGRAN